MSKHKCKYKLRPCPLMDAHKCNERRGFMDKLACQCPCHVEAKRKENAEFLTPDTLIKITITGEADQMTCNACGTVENIMFELCNASTQNVAKGANMSLVATSVQREAEITRFKREHCIKCLQLDKEKLKAALRKR